MKYYNAFLQNLVVAALDCPVYACGHSFFVSQSDDHSFADLYLYVSDLSAGSFAPSKKPLPIKLTSILTYSLIVFILYLVATNYVPIIIKQSVNLVNSRC